MRQEQTEEAGSGWVPQEDLWGDRTLLPLGEGAAQEAHSRQRGPSADALSWQSRCVQDTEQRNS